MAPTRSSRPAFRSEAFAPSGELTWPLSLAEVARSCGLAGFSNRVQRNPGPVTGISEPGLGLFRARCSWGIYGPGLGDSRGRPGEFTGLAWGFLGSDLGNLRAWLGDFSGRTWGIYGTHLGISRVGLGEFTGLAWGFLGSDLGNLRAWLGDFSGRAWGIHGPGLGTSRIGPGEFMRQTQGIYEAQLGIQLPGVGGKPPLVGLC